MRSNTSDRRATGREDGGTHCSRPSEHTFDEPARNSSGRISSIAVVAQQAQAAAVLAKAQNVWANRALLW